MRYGNYDFEPIYKFNLPKPIHKAKLKGQNELGMWDAVQTKKYKTPSKYVYNYCSYGMYR